MSEAATKRATGRGTQGLALTAATLLVSTGGPLARAAAPMAPMAISAARTAVAGLVLGLAGAGQLREIGKLSRADKLRMIAAGLFLGAHFGTWIASLSFTSMTASVALVSTGPAFAALGARLIGDRVTRREWLGIAVAAVGSAVLAGGDWRTGGRALLGDVLALTGAATCAGYLLIGRQLRERVPMTPYLAVVNSVAALGLIASCALTATPLLPTSAQAAIAVICAGAITSAGGHTLINYVVRIIPTHLVALATLGETLISSLIAWLAFREVPPWYAAIGAPLVMLGIGVGFARKASAASTN